MPWKGFLKRFFIFERERQKESMSKSEAETKGEKNPKQALCCQHRAQCGTQTHES